MISFRRVRKYWQIYYSERIYKKRLYLSVKIMSDQASNLRKLMEDKAEAKTEESSIVTFDSNSDLNRQSRVITITSGKGGVGKTNIAVNLAAALKMHGKRVLLIDADIGMANVDVLLGSISKHNMLDLLEDGVGLQDVLVESPHGINYISGSSGVEKALNFTHEERRILHRKLAFCNELADIILIDTGAGLGRHVIDFLIAADEVLLITTPEPTSLSDAFAVLKTYNLHSKRKNIQLIVNRIFDEEEREEVIEKLNATAKKILNIQIECAGYIFEDRSVIDCVKKQKPFIIEKPNCIASKCIDQLADKLINGTEMTITKGWLSFLNDIFRFS